MDNFENKTPDQEPGKEPQQGSGQNNEQPKGPQGAPKTEPQKVYYRPSQQYQQQQYQQYQQRQQQQYGQDPRYVPQGAYQQPAPKSGFPTWAKVLIVIALILVLIVYLMGSCVANIGKAFDSTLESELMNTGTDVTTENATGEYIGVIHVEGTISEDSASTGYNHKYILKSIEDMAKDDRNLGLVLYLNTPGGSVYASDEVYFAIKDYQEKTKRPVYASMQSMAASGGYYISAPCDKIYANRNAFTGSIGVTMGTMYDLTGLLDKLGIKTQTITAGENKAMGSSTEELSQEQYEIYKGLVDEAYEQFTGLVAEGRDMDIKKVKKLADGRIYTARQAKENGLIDEIGTYQECLDAMKKDNALGADVQILDFWPAEYTDIMNFLNFAAENFDKDAAIPSADQIKELVELGSDLRLMCIYRG